MVGNDAEIPQQVREIIAPNENVLYVAKQKSSKFTSDIGKRLFPAMVVLTDRRIVQIYPEGLFGGTLKKGDYSDYPYEGISDIQIHRGVFRATLNIILKSTSSGGKEKSAPENPRISDIDKNEAGDIFGIVREILMKQETIQEVASITVSAAPPLEVERPIQ
jgi:hypothetical protein